MWALNVAKRIIKNNPDKEEYVLNCGTSTTGISHIGNFREISIVYFIKRALNRCGKNAKIVLSFDDYDRFKKVPTGVDPSYSKYIAMPVCDIPSPYIDKVFCDYYEDLFLDELNLLGIEVDAVNQYKRYKGGEYNKYFGVILKNRRMIEKIINDFKTEQLECDENFFPFSIYCDKCNRDLVKIISIDDENYKVTYKCESCGFEETVCVNDCTRLKPIFKVEWPMRWVHEGVDFESSGRSHMTKNGAFDVSSAICENVFLKKRPQAEGYEFVELKGSSGRMSKTVGKTYTITDMLKLYSKKMLLWLFARQKPAQTIALEFGEDVLKNYVEYERFLVSTSEADKELQELLEIDEEEKMFGEITFKQLVAEVGSLKSFDEIVEKCTKGEEFDGVLRQKLAFALHWLEENNKYPKLLDEKNTTYISLLTEERKAQIEIMKNAIIEHENHDDILLKDLLRKKAVEIIENFNFKEAHKDFYNLIFGVDNGAPIDRIVKHFNREEILKLLEINS